MLPSIRHRVLIVACTIASALAWRSAMPFLEPATLGQGWTLGSTTLGLGQAFGVLMLASLPVMALAWVASMTGHVMAGPFVLSASLALLALASGNTRHWVNDASLPKAYGSLAAESPLWFIPAVLLWIGLSLTHRRFQPHWPKLILSGSPAAIDTQRPNIGRVVLSVICTALLAAFWGGGISTWLLADGRAAQLVFGLLIGFALAGMLTRLFLPTMTHPLGLILAPLVVSVIVDLYTANQYRSATTLLSDWYHGRLLGLARALPMHYASAAIAGACLGLGWGQGLSSLPPSPAPPLVPPPASPSFPQ